MSTRTHTEIRSDAAVFADARKRLDDSPTVPGTVRVHVDSDTVTLTRKFSAVSVFSREAASSTRLNALRRNA